MKNKEALLYGIIGILVGSLLTMVVTGNSLKREVTESDFDRDEMMEEAGEEEHMMGMGSSMEEMMESMMGRSGDEFDEQFIEAMIVHHQGAIEMAEEARVSAKHEEIKSLADDIISAQTKEIDQMRQWQEEWGY